MAGTAVSLLGDLAVVGIGFAKDAVLVVLAVMVSLAAAVYGMANVYALFLTNKELRYRDDVVANQAWLDARDEHDSRDWRNWGESWDSASGNDRADVSRW